MAERSRHERPLHLDFVGYDEPGWTLLIGRASDSEPMLDLPDGTLHSRSNEPRPTGLREFLANDFSFSQWS